MQVHLGEEARNTIRRDLAEAHHRLREAQETREIQCKEAADLRRSLGDEAKEKVALQRSCAELRAAVKHAEGERIR